LIGHTHFGEVCLHENDTIATSDHCIEVALINLVQSIHLLSICVRCIISIPKYIQYITSDRFDLILGILDIWLRGIAGH
jgi:hypothetical protein